MTSQTRAIVSASKLPPTYDFVEPFRLARLLYYAALIPLSATAFRPFAGLTFSDWLFFASLGALILELTATRVRSVLGLPTLLVYGAVTFVIGGILSSLNSNYPMESLGFLARFTYLTLIWFWLGVMVLRTRQQIAVAITLWTSSAAIAGFAAIAQALWGYEIVPGGLAGPDFSAIGRMAGVTLHPNDLGAITSVAVVPCLVLLTQRRQPRHLRIAYFATLVLIIGGLIVSGSVGSFVAALVGFAAWIIAFRASRRHLLLLALVGVTATWLTLTPPGSLPFLTPLQRVSQVTANTSGSSLFTRLQLDASTIDVMMRHPIIGVGLDTASQRQFVETPPENMLLLAWLGGGLFGLVGLVLIIASILREAMRKLRIASKPTPWDLCVGLFISFLSTLVFALASPVLQQRYAWIAASLLLAVRAGQQLDDMPGDWRTTSVRSSRASRFAIKQQQG